MSRSPVQFRPRAQANARSPVSSCIAVKSPPRPALVVPAYFGPWAAGDWEATINEAPSIVIINPANGPGHARHPGYLELVSRLVERNVEVFGYVPTTWLTRSHADVATDVARYAEFYAVTGSFFDEIPNAPKAGRIESLRNLASIVGERSTVYNSGQPIPRRWFDALPHVRWGTFEGDPSSLAASVFGGPPERQMHFVHSVTASDALTVAATLADRKVGFACVTSDEMPNPWDVFPDR